MKTIQTPRYKILVAAKSGMCFGVKQAVTAAEALLKERPATILGELAHNPSVRSRLDKLGAQTGSLSGPFARTKDVIITAHGASNKDRQRWKSSGYRVLDTTCPLVHVAHQKLAHLVEEGYHPVIIGKVGHVEVNGLSGDFPHATILLNEDEISRLPPSSHIGIISQTTQPIDKVESLVQKIRNRRPNTKIVFQDTVCRPTKERQKAILELCEASELVIAVGGRNSNNTAQLAKTADKMGCVSYHIETPNEIDPTWFNGISTIGVTAGTSTLPASMEAVIHRLERLATPSPV